MENINIKTIINIKKIPKNITKRIKAKGNRIEKHCQELELEQKHDDYKTHKIIENICNKIINYNRTRMKRNRSKIPTNCNSFVSEGLNVKIT